jgi:hypothetical protein
MNNEALFLFLILLLGLVLCSFLGGNCGKEGMTTTTTTTSDASGNTTTTDASGNTTTTDASGNTTTTNNTTYSSFLDNYNHYRGSGTSTQLQSGVTYIDGSGNSINVVVNIDGTQSLQITQVNQTTPIILTSTTTSPNTFYAKSPLKMTASVITDSNGQTAIKVNLANGQTIIFTQSGSANISSTQYYGSTGSPIQTGSTSTSYNGYYGSSAGAATGPQGNTAYYAQGPQGNTIAGTSSSSSYDYSSSLPQGIPRSQIPSGQEDLYILKSQVVPPVCPVCPTISSSSNDPDKDVKCPPCPACARCPEPSFDCKKVPNYSVIDNQFLPQPVISDFSTFGM